MAGLNIYMRPISMSHRQALMLMVVFAVGITTSCVNKKPAQNATLPTPPIDPSSDVGWILSDGSRARMADYRGQVLVLDFYATWCVPCRESIPGLIALQQELGPQGLQVVGLNVGGADDRVKVAAFARELSIQYPLGFPDQTLTDLFLSDDQTIPQTFVFGREGQLAKRFIGYKTATGAELERAIRSELAADQHLEMR